MANSGLKSIPWCEIVVKTMLTSLKTLYGDATSTLSLLVHILDHEKHFELVFKI